MNKELAVIQQRTSLITQAQAMYLLTRVWPGAPQGEVIKAAIICKQYQLNPLMKTVFLVPFGTGEERTWAVVLGIKASRSIAQQKHKYSYIDGPRVMSEAEQIQIFGQAFPDRFYAICKIQENGNLYPGYGFWLKTAPAYGTDKGNSPTNMAFIRAERNALDKMAPGELPDLEATDESYVVGDFKQALIAGKEQFQEKVDADVKQYWPEPEDNDALANCHRAITSLAIKNGKVEAVQAFMLEQFHVSKTKDLNFDQASKTLDALENGGI